MRESTGTDRITEAKRHLALKEGDIAKGLPITPRMGRVLIDELIEDLKNEYKANDRQTSGDVDRRCTLHLTPFFGGRRAASVTTAEVNRYIATRQKAGAVNATINRELAALKRAFSLAVQCTPPKLLMKPYIPMLEENNVRAGFLEREQFEGVRKQLPEDIRPVVTFAYITGWRTNSEILTLQWSQVDLKAGMVRLTPGATKNKEGRLFPFKVDAELTAVLEVLLGQKPYRKKRNGFVHGYSIETAWQSRTIAGVGARL